MFRSIHKKNSLKMNSINKDALNNLKRFAWKLNVSLVNRTKDFEVSYDSMFEENLDTKILNLYSRLTKDEHLHFYGWECGVVPIPHEEEDVESLMWHVRMATLEKVSHICIEDVEKKCLFVYQDNGTLMQLRMM